MRPWPLACAGSRRRSAAASEVPVTVLNAWIARTAVVGLLGEIQGALRTVSGKRLRHLQLIGPECLGIVEALGLEKAPDDAESDQLLVEDRRVRVYGESRLLDIACVEDEILRDIFEGVLVAGRRNRDHKDIAAADAVAVIENCRQDRFLRLPVGRTQRPEDLALARPVVERLIEHVIVVRGDGSGLRLQRD